VNASAGSRRKANLRLSDLSRPMADSIPDVLTDMLEIAAYVYCADQFTKRGTELMTNVGTDWRRKFRFRIPVQRPDVWGEDSVREALVETLGFLSEDEFSFDFRQATASTGLQPYLGFSDPSAQAISPDEVIMFSGDLDSLAGTVDELIGNNNKAALVSHQSSTTVASKQNGLVNTLRERLNGRQLFYVPVTINKGREEAVTFTRRSRSLIRHPWSHRRADVPQE
jgi:hypothetical protein